jgi:hypothetical protein
MEQRLIEYILLFILYLVTIGLLFAVAVLDKALAVDNIWKIWIERVCLFFGVASFLFTFALPVALFDLQRSRYDAEIERRRADAGIRNDAP